MRSKSKELLKKSIHYLFVRRLNKCDQILHPALIPRATFRNLLEQQPRLAMALWRDTVAEAAVGREWVFNLGRRSAAKRIAHLFSEMHARLEGFASR